MKRRTFVVEQDSALGALTLSELGQQGPALVQRGAVYVDGRRITDPTIALRKGQTVMAVLEEAGVSALTGAPKARPLAILFEDKDLVVVDKPPGITAQATPSRAGDSLADLVSAHLGRQAGLVHRLDKETSGVTVFGKSQDATSRLAAAFREGTVKKQYLAVTGPGMPERGTIELPLSKDPSRPGRWRASSKANGIDAVTEFQRLCDGRFCIIALWPKTGRTHQLRAHLAALGCPILGDTRYGGAATLHDWTAPRCLLHAHRLELPHPRTGAWMSLLAPVPEDLAIFFRAANLDPSLTLPWCVVTMR